MRLEPTAREGPAAAWLQEASPLLSALRATQNHI